MLNSQERKAKKLKQEIAQLLDETFDREDALQYLPEVAREVGCTKEEALAELDRQLK